MNVWMWLGLMLLILVGLITLLLASYLRLEAFLSNEEQIFRLRWLGSQLTIDLKARAMIWQFLDLRVLHKPFKAGENKKTPEMKKPQEKVAIKPLLEERQRLRNLWRYFKRSIHIEHIELNAHLATPDPVWTGMLYGIVSSVIYPLKVAWPTARLRIEADFIHEVPRGILHIRLGVYMFRLAMLGLKALPLIRKLRKHRDRKEDRYGSSSSSQGNRRGYASSS